MCEKKAFKSEDLVVGKYYEVPCAKILYDRPNKRAEIEFVPVIGPAHQDNQFADAPKHYHIDGRFIEKRLTHYQVDEETGRTNVIIKAEAHMELGDIYTVLGIETKKKRCQRLSTGINPARADGKYQKWYNGMIGKSCAGKKCPHYGVEMLEQDGKLVCPLHGLTGDLKAEIIIQRDLTPTKIYI